MLKVKTMQLTPRLARQWLDDRASNRKIKKTVVEKYERLIRSRLWLLTGQPIILLGKDWLDARLVDGQHRCQAVVNSGITVECLVVLNDDPRIVDALDGGTPRTGGDWLFMTGVAADSSVAHSLAAAANATWAIERGLAGQSAKTTPQELQPVIAEHPELLRLVKATQKRGWLWRPQVIGAVAAVRADQKDKALSFMDAILQATAARDTGAAQLRDRMVRENGSRTIKTPYSTRLALTIRALNYWLEDRAVRTLKYTAGSEPFPVLVGLP